MVYMWRMYVFCQIFLIKPPCWCSGIKKACQHRLVQNEMIPVQRWGGLIAKVDLKVQVISKSIKFHPQKRCYNVAHECLTSAKKTWALKRRRKMSSFRVRWSLQAAKKPSFLLFSNEGRFQKWKRKCTLPCHAKAKKATRQRLSKIGGPLIETANDTIHSSSVLWKCQK